MSLKSFPVTKKSRHVNQHVTIKVVQFSRITPNIPQVLADVFQAVNHHATLDATLQSGLLVEGKIDTGSVSHQI